MSHEKNTSFGAAVGQPESYHIVAGSGGCRAMLATLGMLMALRWFGIRKYKSTGGISGGSIPLAFLAAGFSLREIVDMAISLDFESLLDQGDKITQVMIDHYGYSASRQSGSLPAKGRFRMERFEKWLQEKLGGKWPDHLVYWAMATDRLGAQVLLTAQGAFRKQAEGERFAPVTSTPTSPGRAICGSCVVPGFFAPVDLVAASGETEKLYDGALSWESTCPVGVVEDFFAASPGEIIALDVGPELNTYDRIYNTFWRVICGGRCVPPMGRKSGNADKILLVEPAVTGVRSFEFGAHRDKKWLAIMQGFAATVDALNKGYKLTEEQYLRGRDVVTAFNTLCVSLRKKPEGELSQQIEALLAESGVLED